MYKLKRKPDYWLVHYQHRKKPKQYSYLTFGYSVIDVCQKHEANPNYSDTIVCSVTRIIDEEEYS